MTEQAPRHLRNPRHVPGGRSEPGRGVPTVFVLLTALLISFALVTGARLGFNPVEAITGPIPANPAWPTPLHAESRTPLGTPTPVTAGSDAYTFISGNSDHPAAFDPCRPVHYTVNEHDAPPGGDRIITEAVARVSRATGLVFISDGTTDEAPSPDRQGEQQTRYGDRWAPVLIAWVTPQENPEFTPGVLGRGGGFTATILDGTPVVVTGQIQLNGPELGGYLSAGDKAGRDMARAVLLHELGHVVGLGHSTDPHQIMFSETTGVTDYGAGDLAGLARLGRGRCEPRL